MPVTTVDWCNAVDALGGLVVSLELQPNNGNLKQLIARFPTTIGLCNLKLFATAGVDRDLGTPGVAIYTGEPPEYRGRTPLVGHGQRYQLPAAGVLHDVLTFLKLTPTPS